MLDAFPAKSGRGGCQLIIGGKEEKGEKEEGEEEMQEEEEKWNGAEKIMQENNSIAKLRIHFND